MTDIRPPRRRLLPLLTASPVRHGTTSHTTCFYKCGNACDKPVPNRTDNPTFASVVQSAVSRRNVLKAAGVSALVVAAGPALPAAAHGRRSGTTPESAAADAPLTFQPVEQNFLDELVVPSGYSYSVVMRWGDPVEEGAPRFDIDAQTPEAQAKQFGYNCDFIGWLPLDDRNALLVVNHEYTDEQLMFGGVADEEGAGDISDEQKRVAMMAHGISVVQVRRVGQTGQWRPTRDRGRNRRITATTPMEVTGPAAGSEYLKTGADPTGRTVLGTLNNCAGGITPWGTTLHGEENFNQYFGSSAPITVDAQLAALERYGISAEDVPTRQWQTADPRFDLVQEPNEVNRFGWVVEVDPFDPHSTPRKHSSLGRFKHEGADIRIAEDGRVVAYSGDDERFEYVYKFVSKRRYREGERHKAHNMTLLEEGDLYVARFTGDSPPAEIDGSGRLPSDGEFDGTGTWIPLVLDGESMIPGKDVAWVLTFTRQAVDRLGKRLDADGDPVLDAAGAEIVEDPSKVPTKMDRPEDIQTNPVNGRVYVALTNNSRRTGLDGRPGADEANPLTRSWAFDEGSPAVAATETEAAVEAVAASFSEQPGNNNGHVIEWEERGEVTATEFSWRIFLLAGDPERPETYFAGYDKSQVSAISCPDNLEFDAAGNLWISTDGTALSTRNQEAGTVGGTNDGLFAVPTAGPERGHLKAFLTVPVGAECSGPMIPADGRSVFVSAQHPGETDGSTLETPSSTWPDRLPVRPFPRPSVAVVFRHDGQRVGV
ncbi:hypothetical protein SAMN06893096_10378 [Geodermatophilus pulveris]|uniref:Channel forming colicins domain-containing protein n=1 Tax=Geodermatophilus pulveris TaxID=1564159 RepID=A0A239DAR8_9ACTN|nr:PhoX family phosphatase [Geodermatophilus pulveris]SNS28971.1 hypothetical protein SAMN06893096_10378 [Geodermatophilus pulveris]